MNQICRTLVLLTVTMYIPTALYSQGNSLAELDWQYGPTTGYISNKATIEVPDGYVFLGSEDTMKLMEMMENIPSPNEYVFAPEDLSWFAVFEFDPVGYVKDDETLDPQPLLDAVTKGTEQSNEERSRRGWGTMSILGWRFQPRYDEQTNLLEWAFIAQQNSDDTQIVNYNTRLLGRTGVMSVVLVDDPAELETSVASFKDIIRGYDFVPGEKYADYSKGDRVAEFGLAALVVGGAAAVATKKGLWAVIAGIFAAAWKFLAAAVVAMFVWLFSLFKSKT